MTVDLLCSALQGGELKFLWSLFGGLIVAVSIDSGVSLIFS